MARNTTLSVCQQKNVLELWVFLKVTFILLGLFVVCLKYINRQAANAIPINMIYKVFEALYIAMPYLFSDLKVVSLFSGIGSMEKALDRLYKAINLVEKVESENSRDSVEIVVDSTMFILSQMLKNRVR